jgi:hypothetical protein
MELRAACLLVAVVLMPVFGRADDDLSAQLAAPIPASIQLDEAKQRVAAIQALADAHPDRRAEIDAYLIPYTRAIEAATPPTPTPTPEPMAPPKPKPLVLVREPGGVTALRATSVQQQGPVAVVECVNGTRAVVQPRSVIAQLPWYSDADLNNEALDLRKLAAMYEATARNFPSLRAALSADAAHFQAIVDGRVKDAQLARQALHEQAVQIMATRYDPKSGYTAEDLAKLLLDAEKIRHESPADADDIDAWAAPFRRHFLNLLAGHIYVNGGWTTAEEIAKRKLAARQAAFLEGLHYQLDPMALSAADVSRAAREPLIILLLVMLMAAGVAVIFRKRPRIMFSGLTVCCCAPLVLAFLFFLATRRPSDMPLTADNASEKPVVAALASVAGVGDSRATHDLTEDALNVFLARHVAIAPLHGSADATRQAIVIRLLPGRILVFQMVRALGLDWIVRCDLSLQSSGGRQSLLLTGVSLGKVACPPALSREIWNSLEPGLTSLFNASRLEGDFQVPADGVLRVTASAGGSHPGA